jgi:hypothetical protein
VGNVARCCRNPDAVEPVVAAMIGIEDLARGIILAKLRLPSTV